MTYPIQTYPVVNQGSYPYGQPVGGYAYGGFIAPTGYVSQKYHRYGPKYPKFEKKVKGTQPTKWNHPSSQAAAAVYLGQSEKWPKIAPAGAGMRRSHVPLPASDYNKPSKSSSGAFQASIEPPAHTLPLWAAPVGLPPSVMHCQEYGVKPIEPYVTAQNLPQAF
eukprot:TRINITY_DN9923_c0_g1_i1.p1 TRINITY_DN9923_c0_g1~~TRINITY_DN9923_c0_g1_i1.p1  ORF type:complete len:164 (-),score=22.96 TRINITY_DN9923_c0_g1_i1:129-620(-)